MKAITCILCGRWEAPSPEPNIPMEAGGYAHTACLRVASARALSAVAMANEGAPGNTKRDPVHLVARHCRTCNTVTFGRKDTPKGVRSDAHPVPGIDAPCQSPDYGPEVIVAVVPW
jgi:hypothetical protein